MLPTCAFDTPAQFPCRQLRFLPPDDAAVVAGNFVDFKSARCQSAPLLLRIILPPHRFLQWPEQGHSARIGLRYVLLGGVDACVVHVFKMARQ